MFCPKSVAVYKDKDLKRIITKALENIIKKKNLRDLYKNLEYSLRDLRR